MTEIKMENGRSMVEMLGVLAVMGVLSIGGVAGYRYAMDKMNANDIINEVRKRAVTASQQRILGHDINLSEYGDNGRIKGIHAVTATNDYAGDEGFFALTVSAVPQRVCDEILKQDWAMPVETAVGEFIVEDDTVCDVGDNEMLFAFHNTLDSSRVPGEIEEQACGPGETPCGQICCPSGQVCLSDDNALPICGCATGYWDGTDCVACLIDEHCADDVKGLTKCSQRTNTCICAEGTFLSDGTCVACIGSNPTGFQTWDETYINQCQESCDPGEYYTYTSGNCQRPTGGICATMPNISQPNYDIANDQEAVSKMGMANIMGEEKARQLADKFVVMDIAPTWWAAKAICLEMGYKMATLDDIGCGNYSSGDQYCYNSETFQAIMAMYGERMYWLDKPFTRYDGGACAAYAADGTRGYIGNVHRYASLQPLCVK